MLLFSLASAAMFVQVPILVLVEHSSNEQFVPESTTASQLDLSRLRELQSVHVNVCNVDLASFAGLVPAMDWLQLAMQPPQAAS